MFLLYLGQEHLKELLDEASYDCHETAYLCNGFKRGFDLGYRGPTDRQDEADNLPFREGIGNPTELWNKVMDEVQLE